MKKIIIIGNFGYYDNDLNGQTMRTRTIYKSLAVHNDKFKTVVFDTSQFMQYSLGKKTLVLFKLFINLLLASKAIIMPGQKSIRKILWLLYVMNTVFLKKFFVITIGGWLNDYIEKNTFIFKYLKRAEFIFVQTPSLKEELKKKGLKQTVYFPNYRIYNKNDIPVQKKGYSLKNIVMYSRVTKSKGIIDGITAVNSYNKTDNNIPLNLDIFGPIDKEFKDELYDILKYSENITYKGILQPDLVRRKLSRYDLLIFPTYYEGEGHPGTLIDSFFAYLPSITSKWKYNEDLVVDRYNGLLVNPKAPDEILEKLLILRDNPILLKEYSYNCRETSEQYQGDIISNILISRLN